MTNFEIVVENSVSEIREDILKFWEKYLPGTPSKRLDWLERGNPAGLTLWILAINRVNKEIIGMVTIIPREFFIYGEKKRIGVVGDFMVHEKYRVFGPALQLQKTVMENYIRLGFDMLYTIPNKFSKKLIIRVGYKYSGPLKNYCKPIKYEYYLKKYINPIFITLIYPIFYILTIPRKYIFSSDIKNIFDTSLNNELLTNINNIVREKMLSIGDRKTSFINWRFSYKTINNYRIIYYHENRYITGYLIYSIKNQKLNIHDLIIKETRIEKKIIKHLINIAYKNKVLGIYIKANASNPLLRILKKYYFIDTKSDDFGIYYWPEKSINIDSFYFLDIDDL